MKIHKEGHKLLIYTLLLLTVINVVSITLIRPHQIVTGAIVLISLVLFGFVLQFFRNPHISIEKDAKKILSPADGKIVVIEKTRTDEFIEEERIQVSIFMSPLNVHVNRNPIAGTVKYLKYHPGKYLVAWHPKSSTLNERTTIIYESDNGILLPIRQIAGAVARRIKWYINEGDAVEQGDEFGL